MLWDVMGCYGMLFDNTLTMLNSRYCLLRILLAAPNGDTSEAPFGVRLHDVGGTGIHQRIGREGGSWVPSGNG
jgi:hypothetical protein